MIDGNAAPGVVRKSVSLPGGGCDVRVGAGALHDMGKELRSLVGRPRVAVGIVRESTPTDLVEEIERQVADGRFALELRTLPDGPLADVEHAAWLLGVLDDCSATADDLLVAVGDVEVVSLASQVSGMWCAGMPLAVVPTDALACMEGVVTPRALDTASGSVGMIGTSAHASIAFCDTSACDMFAGEQFDLALALAASTAVADNSDAFGRLGSRAAALLDHGPQTLAEQIADVLNCRGSLVNSSSLAVRQGINYGRVMGEALGELLEGVSGGVLVAEGMRFASRLAVGLGKADIDLVFAQDALLDDLGLGEIACELEPDDLVDALRSVCLRRTNRFLLPLPLAFGRVRLASVDDGLLAEHAAAWCESRSDLLYEDEPDGDGEVARDGAGGGEAPTGGPVAASRSEGA